MTILNDRPTPNPLIQAHADLKDVVGELKRTKVSGQTYYQYFDFPKGRTLRIAHSTDPSWGFASLMSYELSGHGVPGGSVAGFTMETPISR